MHRHEGNAKPAESRLGYFFPKPSWVNVPTLLLGSNLGRTIVTNGDFTAYVCDSAATRPFSKSLLADLFWL